LLTNDLTVSHGVTLTVFGGPPWLITTPSDGGGLEQALLTGTGIVAGVGIAIEQLLLTFMGTGVRVGARLHDRKWCVVGGTGGDTRDW